MENRGIRGVVECQILSKVIQDKNWNIIENNELGPELFNTNMEDESGAPVGQYADVYNFIKSHINIHHNVPDPATVQSHFPYFELVEVNESDEYLVGALKSEYGDIGLVDLMNKANKIHQNQGKKAAADYIADHIAQYRDIPIGDIGIDLIQGIDKRVDRYNKAVSDPRHAFILTGFPDLDKIVGGFNRSEELAIIQGRSGQSKTFLLLKFLYEAWKNGENVAFYEPEMSDDIIGYRLDALMDENHNISNFALVRANQLCVDYNKFAEQVKKHTNIFKYIEPRDFQHECTVSKLRNFCKHNNITVLGIDGIELGALYDEKANKFTSEPTQLTHIAEDLLTLSREMNIPVIATVQSHRIAEGEKIGIDTVAGAYGISRKCTMMLTMNKNANQITIGIEKQRNGQDKASLTYNVDLDKGNWAFDGSGTAQANETQEEKKKNRTPNTLVKYDNKKVETSKINTEEHPMIFQAGE